MFKKRKWYKKLQKHYKNELHRIAIENIKTNKIVVYSDKYLKLNNLSQKNRETFVYPLHEKKFMNLNKNLIMLCKILEKFIKYILINPKLKEELGFNSIDTSLELDNVLFDYIRCDGFYDDKKQEYKLIEINSFSPSMYENSDTILKFSNNSDLRPQISQLIAQSHFEISQLLLKQTSPTVLLLVDATTGDEYLKVMNEVFRGQNLIIKTFISRIDIAKHFHLMSGNLYYDETLIDQIIIRCKHKMFRKNGTFLNDDVKQAYTNKTLSLIPSPKNLIIGKKSLFPLLHSIEIQKNINLSQTEISLLNKLIPISIPLSEAINCKDIIENKDKWVLKYSDRSSGKHIYLGSSYIKSEWIKLIDIASKRESGIIMQEKILPPHGNMIVHGKSHKINLPFSFEPFIVNLPLSVGYVIAGFSSRAYLGENHRSKVKFNPSSNNENIAFGTVEII